MDLWNKPDGTRRHPATSGLLAFFNYEHLPPTLREVSQPFGELAERVADTVPEGAEMTAGLRKLLEAKDCVVRASLPRPVPPETNPT